MSSETIGAITLKKEKLKSLRKGLVISYYSQEHLNAYWDCLELEAYIRTNTAHNIYKLDMEVPKMVMSGET